MRRDAFRLIVIFAFAAGWATPLFAEDAATCATLASEFEARRAELEPPQISAALFKAADFGCETFANRLLESGASVAARDRMGGAALAHAARGGHDGVARLLLAHGAVVDLRDVQGSTPLYAAVEGNRYRAAAVLLASGADVNLPGRAGVTPLAAAAYNGNLKIADLLLAHGADASLRDLGGKAPILYAAARGFGSVVTRLLATGVGINDAYGNKLTLLMWAAGHANDVPVDDGVALVAMLLDKGALIDARDNRGRTALMTAASLGHDEIVALLLKRGADARLKDLAGKTAADLATSETTRITLAARSTP